MFQGVPFAAAPVGPLRFRPPVDPEPWAGVRETTQSGPAAPQFSLPVFSWLNAAGGRVGDDCLSLNVWTPGLDSGRRSVLVWIHGGGFLVGSGATPVYNGADLSRRGDVVVVTINYRLGALGFSHLGLLPKAASRGFEGATNVGIRDQIKALEWVHEHIDRFGGDPNSVTVFGQSAGGMSVGSLLGSPKARPLFQRAIPQSGAGDHVQQTPEAQEVADRFAHRLGLGETTPDLLGEVPTAQIMEAQRGLLIEQSDLGNLMVLLPAVDGDLLPKAPLQALRDGDAAHIPIMTGATLEEWKLFRVIDQGIGRFSQSDLVDRFRAISGSWPRLPRAESAAKRFRAALEGRAAADHPGDVWSAFQSARHFHMPAHRLLEAHHEGGGTGYHYMFTWRAPAMRRSLGSCHAIEIPFLFGSTGHPFASPLTGLSRRATKLSHRLQHAWVRFARNGRPGHERLPTWPSYDPERRSTLFLGRECSLEENPLEAERDLLEGWIGRAPIRGLPGKRRGVAARGTVGRIAERALGPA